MYPTDKLAPVTKVLSKTAKALCEIRNKCPVMENCFDISTSMCIYIWQDKDKCVWSSIFWLEKKAKFIFIFAYVA